MSETSPMERLKTFRKRYVVIVKNPHARFWSFVFCLRNFEQSGMELVPLAERHPLTQIVQETLRPQLETINTLERSVGALLFEGIIAEASKTNPANLMAAIQERINEALLDRGLPDDKELESLIAEAAAMPSDPEFCKRVLAQLDAEGLLRQKPQKALETLRAASASVAPNQEQLPQDPKQKNLAVQSVINGETLAIVLYALAAYGAGLIEKLPDLTELRRKHDWIPEIR